MSMRARAIAAIAVVVCFTGPSIAQPTAQPTAQPAAQPPPAPSPRESAPPAAAPEPPSPPGSASAPAAPAVAPVPAPSQPTPASAPAPTPTPTAPAPAAAAAAAATPRPPPQGERLSESTAISLSLLGTLGSWALFRVSLETGSVGVVLLLGAGSLIVGPNLGHWYQGTAFTRGTGLRIVALTAAAYGFVRAVACEEACSDNDPLILLGGALLYLGATVDDILTAPARVRAHNKRLEVLGVTPLVTDRTAGLGLVGRF